MLVWSGGMYLCLSSEGIVYGEGSLVIVHIGNEGIRSNLSCSCGVNTQTKPHVLIHKGPEREIERECV